jgi:hypothetical protein
MTEKVVCGAGRSREMYMERMADRGVHGFVRPTEVYMMTKREVCVGLDERERCIYDQHDGE